MPLSRPLFERRHVLASSILGSFGLFVPSAANAASTAPPGPAPAITEAGTTVEGPARTTNSSSAPRRNRTRAETRRSAHSNFMQPTTSSRT